MKATDFKHIDSPESFWNIIPRDLVENLKFRIDLHSYLVSDVSAQQCYKELCFAKPQIAFDTAFWTYDARKPVHSRNQPFILRPKQIIAVEAIKDAIDNQHDLIVDKSRDEGATELICKMYDLYFWLVPDTSFLVGSRKEHLVDDSVEYSGGRLIGPHQCLFHKLMYGLVNLPVWANVKFSKKHLFIQNLDNSSLIEGEATNQSFGAGNRATSALIDELARIEPDIAGYIVDNIHDTTPCAIFNSTHFRWGAGHRYAQLLRSNKIPTVILDWESNPEKNIGLYSSPEKDIILVKDVNYYNNLYPNLDFQVDKSFNWTNLKATLERTGLENEFTLNFVADGGEGNWGRDRSLWFDAEEARARSKADVAQNICRIPQGSADQVFDNEVIAKVRTLYVKEPDAYGIIKFNINDNIITNPTFVIGTKRSPLKWWGKLPPDKTHNFIVSCDISRGTGASNSVLSICDINQHEIVGIYANPFIDVSDFAELTVAVCKWLDNAYLIWEANGPGDTFCNRIVKYGYSKVYIRRNERTYTREKSKSYGWSSTPGVNGTKLDLLMQLDAALNESIKKDKLYRWIIIHDEAAINEFEDYMFDAGKIDAMPSNSLDETTGARYAHGDRVISIGLAVLAQNEMRPQELLKKQIPPVDSFQYRFNLAEEEEAEKRTWARERKW